MRISTNSAPIRTDLVELVNGSLRFKTSLHQGKMAELSCERAYSSMGVQGLPVMLDPYKPLVYFTNEAVHAAVNKAISEAAE